MTKTVPHIYSLPRWGRAGVGASLPVAGTSHYHLPYSLPLPLAGEGRGEGEDSPAKIYATNSPLTPTTQAPAAIKKLP